MRPEQLRLLPIAPVTLQAVGATHIVAGLFAGIGGIERGLHRAGHRTVMLCESDPAAVAVLQRRFVGVPVHSDVCNLHRLPQRVSLLTAGFPCQDLSQTGATRGIAGSRSGLVGQVFRLLKKYGTPWVLLENVPFMLQLARGEAMNVITTAFENLGYRWAYRVVDARAFGLPQRRRRVFFLATNVGDPRAVLFADEAGPIEEPRLNGHRVACGFYWTEGNRGLGWAVDSVPTLKGGSAVGIPSPPAILMEDGRVVTPSIRDAERLQGFPKDWTKPAEAVTKRGTRWKLVGNAVSVRAAEWLGRRLARPSRPLNFETSVLLDSHHWPDAAWNVGGGRVRVEASDRPVTKPYSSLSKFLLDPAAPLSIKATAGFLSRAQKARLNFPPGFLDALRVHLDHMEAQVRTQSRVSRSSSVRSASRVVAPD
jgi:DNA (cytosine-5)-methyltransferase 1